MEFTQRHLFTRRRLALTPEGLLVHEQRLNGQHEQVLPYEDLLPISVVRHHETPVFLTALAALLLGTTVLDLLKTTYSGGLIEWASLLLVGALALGLGGYALRGWRRQFLIHTGRGPIELLDRSRDRPQLHAFVEFVRAHTAAQLRRKYSTTDPRLPTEPQLKRLLWLHAHDVISTRELQSLQTRLSGAPAAVLRFGNDIAPSVN